VAFLEVSAYVLWMVGGFVLVAALILFAVSVRLWYDGRIARATPRSDCSQVRAGPKPVRVSGTSAPGPWGPLRGRLSRADCVWYRERVFRMHWRDVSRDAGTDGGGFELVPQRAEELIWEWHSGPFAIRDGTGSVLVAPELLHRTTTAGHRGRGNVARNLAALARQGGPEQFLTQATRDLGYPAEVAIEVAREEGAGAWRDWAEGLGTLLADGLLPASLLDQYADPGARTIGYRVVEEIVPPERPFNAFAMLADMGGQPILAVPYRGVPTISVQALPKVLDRGGRRGTGCAVVLGLTGVGCFAAGALLLRAAGIVG
jgi:hypothetical protein